MTPAQFVRSLKGAAFDNVFNPYTDRCEVHDLDDAPDRRAKALLTMLKAAARTEVDSLWIGRDLGYRGGRRTGLALTDDVHLALHAIRWNIKIERATTGSLVGERTATVIWSMLASVPTPVFLWNVFPFHPHEPGDPFTNRSHSAKEREMGEAILAELILMLRPRRLICIGNDAAKTALRLAGIADVVRVRHPSYGGQSESCPHAAPISIHTQDRFEDHGVKRAITSSLCAISLWIICLKLAPYAAVVNEISRALERAQ